MDAQSVAIFSPNIMSVSPQTKALLDDIYVFIQQTIISVKKEFAISYLHIIPAIFQIGFKLRLASTGVNRTFVEYSRLLTSLDEINPIKSSQIKSATPLSQPDIDKVIRSLSHVVETLQQHKYPNEYIAEVFTYYAYELAENRVDKMFGVFIIRDLNNKARELLDKFPSSGG